MNARELGAQHVDYHPELSDSCECGLTKREFFAAMAMQGLLANPYYAKELAEGNVSGDCSSSALYHADAVLAALTKAETP